MEENADFYSRRFRFVEAVALFIDPKFQRQENYLVLAVRFEPGWTPLIHRVYRTSTFSDAHLFVKKERAHSHCTYIYTYVLTYLSEFQRWHVLDEYYPQ